MLFRIIKKILRAAIVIFLLMMAVAVAAYFHPEKFLCVDSGKVSADVIVVLGGGSHERPERAAELFKEQAAPDIIVSGFGDAEINRRILIENGVPPARVALELQSHTTRENAQFTIRLLRERNIHNVIIVTSWYHSRRALKTFEHYAPDLKFYSRPSYFEFARKDWSRIMTKRIYLEFLKLSGYWIRYGVCPL